MVQVRLVVFWIPACAEITATMTSASGSYIKQQPERATLDHIPPRTHRNDQRQGHFHDQTDSKHKKDAGHA